MNDDDEEENSGTMLITENYDYRPKCVLFILGNGTIFIKRNQ